MHAYVCIPLIINAFAHICKYVNSIYFRLHHPSLPNPHLNHPNPHYRGGAGDPYPCLGGEGVSPGLAHIYTPTCIYI